jgi:ADP-ribose pyrophosphatase YjhB (NUDIX family)
MKPEKALILLQRLKAIAETGLVYSESGYDLERYEEVRKIALELLGGWIDEPIEKLNGFFMAPEDYPTPKVDVRAFVRNENGEVLLAQESVDGKWTIPGGWADIGETPQESVLKEVKEETGLEAEVVRLLAVYDKRCHPHPPRPHYVYKLVFECCIKGGELQPGFDMQGAAFFNWNRLPDLSEDRILRSQLEQLKTLAEAEEAKVYFD